MLAPSFLVLVRSKKVRQGIYNIGAEIQRQQVLLDNDPQTRSLLRAPCADQTVEIPEYTSCITLNHPAYASGHASIN